MELVNIEIKSPAQSGSVPIYQNLKNVRLKRCIQRALEELGMADATVIGGDIVGMIGMIFAVLAAAVVAFDKDICIPCSSSRCFHRISRLLLHHTGI